jgi:serine/threonine protein kinase
MPPGDPASPSQTPRWSVDELIPFGKYILLNKMSSGATAAVYKAKIRGEAGFERIVTIKRILPQMAGDPDFVETFVREAKICARLTHESICPTYELGKVGESLYMASEWLAGKDLGALIRRLQYIGRVMPPLMAAWIASRMCDALDYAHNLKDIAGKPIGIVHRDLSPANIVISYDGQVKLIDFGLAKATGRAQQTNVDALKQKIGYMSPELVRGLSLDARSDLFGVGVCLYEMVTGRRLFAGADDIATLKLVSHAVVPPPSALLEDTPDELEMIMMRALEKDPEQRWPNAAEMAQALSACVTADDPSFGTRNLAEFMHELFANDMLVEQRRQNDLLAASQNAALMEQRRRFFASPLGAAAIAKAEAARRAASNRPPPLQAPQPAGAKSSLLAPPLAAAAAVPAPGPDELTPVGESTDDELTTFQDASTGHGPAKGANRTNGADENSDDELTTYQADEAPSSPGFDPVALARSDRPARYSIPPDAGDEPTTFAPALTREVAGETARPHTDEEVTVPPRPFDEEATAFFNARMGGPPVDGPFEEEATQILFSQTESIDLPDVPDEEIAGVANPEPLPVPLTAQQRAAIGGDPSRRRGGAMFTTSKLTGRGGASSGQSWAGVSAREAAALVSSDFMNAAPTQRWLIASVIGLLIVAIVGIVVKTPLGVAMGLRKPPDGVIEVRTVPAAAAAVRLDGIYRGRSPLRLEGVRAGQRVIALDADGYLPVTRQVALEGGDTLKVNVPLEPQPGAANTP